MSALSPLPALLAILLALVCARRFVKLDVAESGPAQRFATIEGLRGYLAFFVFLHHASYWYFYVRNGQWGGIESRLYLHFGQSSVALFFMITAFLFGSKLVDGRRKPIDWQALFVGRLARLAPLYLLQIAALFLLVAIGSHFELREPIFDLLRDAASWLGFAVFGEPDLNNAGVARIGFAGVNWSLPYEWCFYAALPVFALLLGQRPALRWWLGGLLVAATIFGQLSPWTNLCFLGGLAAVPASRTPVLREFAGTRMASAMIVLMLVVLVGFYPTGGRVPLLLQSLIFILIACGNSLFGAMNLAGSRALGQIGYSVYLLHGGVLYLCFRYVIGPATAAGLTPLAHWAAALACVPVVIALCSFTYRHVEVPGMVFGRKIVSRRRRLIAAPSVAEPKADTTG